MQGNVSLLFNFIPKTRHRARTSTVPKFQFMARGCGCWVCCPSYPRRLLFGGYHYSDLSLCSRTMPVFSADAAQATMRLWGRSGAGKCWSKISISTPNSSTSIQCGLEHPKWDCARKVRKPNEPSCPIMHYSWKMPIYLRISLPQVSTMRSNSQWSPGLSFLTPTWQR